jgi:hypothetical protein
VYALARSKKDGIRIWFWPRTSSVIRTILTGDSVDPDHWSTPTAYFPTGDNCDYAGHFDAHKLVFDLTFCVRRSLILHSS